MEILEIVSNEAAKRLVTDVTGNKVYSLYMNLSIGKLDGLKNYKREELKEYSDILTYDFVDVIKEIERTIDEYDSIRIWSSIFDSDDYCLLLFMCNIFKDKNIRVIFSNEFNNHALSINCVDKEDLSNYFRKEHILKKYEKESFCFEWEKVLKENSNLRFMINGEVISVKIDYFDNEIINRLQKFNRIYIYEFIADLMINTLIPKVSYSDWIYMYLLKRLEQNRNIKSEIIDSKEFISIIKK